MLADMVLLADTLMLHNYTLRTRLTSSRLQRQILNTTTMSAAFTPHTPHTRQLQNSTRTPPRVSDFLHSKIVYAGAAQRNRMPYSLRLFD